MISVQILRIQLENFRSFLHSSVIDFEKTGLVLVEGFNQDTGGSSAAGKSSLIMAIAHNIGYCGVPSSELRTWNTESVARTIGEYDCNGVLLKIDRSGKLLVWLNGESVEGNIAYKQSVIEKTVGCSMQIFELLTYRPQKSSGLFLNKSDAEKREFLVGVLGLNLFEEALVLSENNTNRLSNKQLSVNFGLGKIKEKEVQLKASLSTIKSNDFPNNSLDKITTRLESLNKEIQVCERKVAVLNEVLNNPMEIGGIIDEVEGLSDLVNRYRESVQTHIRVSAKTEELFKLLFDEQIKKVKVLFKKLRLLRKKNLVLEKKKKRAAAIPEVEKKISFLKQSLKQNKDLLGSLKKELAALNEQKCFACLRKLETDQHLSILSSKEHEISLKEKECLGLEEKITNAQKKMAVLEGIGYDETVFELARNCVFVLQSEYDELSAIVGATDKQKAHRFFIDKYLDYKKIVQEEKAACSVRTIAGDEIGALFLKERVNLDNKLSMREMLTLDFDMWEKHRIKESQKIEEHLLDISRVEEEIQKQNDVLLNIMNEIQRESDFQKLINKEGFLGFIFDEILQDISNEANAYLARIPNVQSINIQFVSEVVTQKGTTKKNIKPLFRVGGDEIISLRSFSGGQMSSIDLAIELAIQKVLRQRIQYIPGWLILDEIFDGQDMVTKEACLEILKEFGEDRLILIIDHSGEFKEMFKKQIKIVSKNGYSYVSKE
jgi:DNA repair exonuclease SbcCD ATPase subunit